MKNAQSQNVAISVVKPRPGAEPTTFQKHSGPKGRIDPVDDDLEIARQKLSDAQRQNQDFDTIAEKLAHTSIYTKNVTVDELELAFPGRYLDWNVDQLFHAAKGGPLYVDFAPFPYDVAVCRRKAEVLRRANLRYVWLEPNDTVESAERKLKGELK